MEKNTAQKEQNIPQHDTLDEVIEAVKKDAQITPDQYLKDSVVPKGGE